MPADPFKFLATIDNRLVSLASEDAQLRSDLRELAHAVLKATDTPKQVSSTETQGDVARKSEEVIAGDGAKVAEKKPAQPLRADQPSESPVARPELRLGSASTVEPAAPSYPVSHIPTPDTDLPLIEVRCRLKAEGARWVATRHRLIREGANFFTDIEPMNRDIIARAKAIPDCFLWMCHPSGPSPSDLRLYDDVAGCFEVVADVLTLLRQILDEPDLYPNEFEHTLDFLAEAQSALQVSISAIDGPVDTDQMKVFSWLKQTASENQIFIQRYMRANDPADPSLWEDLSSRVEELDEGLQETRSRAKKRRKLLGKVRHKLSLIADDPGGAEEHWQILVTTVEELVSDGMPPSNRELRELLIPVIEDLPELSDVPKGFQLVLREIDRFIATCPPPATTSTTQPTAEVREVANLLNGRSMVLIGGDRRPGSQQALKEAFNLQDLLWIETKEHQSVDSFEPYIAREDVAVVLLAIRWCSHSHKNVKPFCDRHGKPLVRLLGGYSPNQVAVRIKSQCSEQLQAE